MRSFFMEYGGNIIFGGAEAGIRDLDKAGIVILPVPYDRTSTWIKGADKGPFSILEASSALEFYDIETDFEVWKKGIYTSLPITGDIPTEELVVQVENKVLEFNERGKFVVVLGGEHSVSIGAVKAAAGIKDLSVLQLDAHADLRGEYEGSKYNHACVGARIKDLCPLVQVGIRSMSAEEKTLVDPDRMFYAKDIIGGQGSRNNGQEWMDGVADRLSDNVYVTIDLDVFDPSLLPATGTPEPGGLMWYDVMRLLRKISGSKNIVGFDCVELCPMENNKASDFAAAKLVYGFLSYIFK